MHGCEKCTYKFGTGLTRRLSRSRLVDCLRLNVKFSDTDKGTTLQLYIMCYMCGCTMSAPSWGLPSLVMLTFKG